ncbi:MAG: hypothetical protein H6600_04405 [Flavobacteriales bacterium]|nr:hypothetical protein [Flavobacteriales bacterium]
MRLSVIFTLTLSILSLSCGTGNKRIVVRLSELDFLDRHLDENILVTLENPFHDIRFDPLPVTDSLFSKYEIDYNNRKISFENGSVIINVPDFFDSIIYASKELGVQNLPIYLANLKDEDNAPNISIFNLQEYIVQSHGLSTKLLKNDQWVEDNITGSKDVFDINGVETMLFSADSNEDFIYQAIYIETFQNLTIIYENDDPNADFKFNESIIRNMIEIKIIGVE